MSPVVRSSVANKAQIVCIDLPGESVKCWRSTDKVQVILKKHRDIIFDLNLGGGKIYTVESSDSDFYHADEKKLVAGGGKQRVLFSDGMRLHLWISRDFKGELELKSAGKLLMKLDPAKLDKNRYDGDPKTKPLPIVIAIGAVPTRSAPAHTGTAPQKFTSPVTSPPQPIAASAGEDCTIVCVVDGDLKGIPEAVWEKLKSGGGNSGLAELDPFDIATRNWLLGQVAGAAAYAGDNWKWLRASIDGKTHTGFKLVKAKIHYVNNKARYYFSGYSKANSVFGPGGFGAGHERVLSIYAGAGKASSALAGATEGIKNTLKKNALVAFIFGTVTSLAEWKADLSKDGYDLAASLLVNLLKTYVVVALTSAVVALLMTAIMFGLSVSVPTLAVGVVTVVVGIGLAYAVDVVDKELGYVVGGKGNESGLSGVVAKALRENIQKNWNFLKDKKFWDYEEQWFEKFRFD